MATWSPDQSKLDFDALAASLAAHAANTARLGHGPSKGSMANPKKKGKSNVKKGLHFLGQVLKVLDTPRNTIMTGALESSAYGNTHAPGQGYNPIDDIGAFIHGAKRGFTRQDYTGGREFMKEFNKGNVGLDMPTEGVAGAVAGFGVDVAADPLSYLGVGMVTKGAKKGEEVKRAVRAERAQPAPAAPELPPELVEAVAKASAQVEDIKLPEVPQELMQQSAAVKAAQEILDEIPAPRALLMI